MIDFRVIAPYPEGAIVQIAHLLARRDQLESVHLAERIAAAFARSAARRGLMEQRVADRLSRGRIDLPEAQFHKPLLELTRMAMSGFAPRVALPRAAFRLKRGVDVSAARSPGAPRVQIGLPASVLSSFMTHPGALNVFHAVDAHPEVHNAALVENYGAAARFEMLGGAEVATIRKELELADIVLVPSTVVGQGMVSRGVPASKIVRIPYGVDLSTFAPATGAMPAVTRRPQVVYVGQLSFRKGVPTLLEAVRGTGVQVSMYGPAINKDLLRELPEEVRYRGRVPHAEVANALANADAFVIPSIEDACPLVVAEASASGLPVIASDAVGAVEDMDARDVHVVQAGSVAELRDAIRATEPLGSVARRERADRIRRTSSVLGWEAYSERVIDTLQGMALNP